MTEIQRLGSEPPQKPGKSKQDYGTPPEFIASVVERFGPLVCDLAASLLNRKAPQHYDESNDSLKQPWAEHHPTGNLWLNPPFGDIEPWASKCTAESHRRLGLIIMLTPASIGSNWFAKHVNRKAVVLGLSPRMSFEGTTDPYPKDLMLTLFGLGIHGFDCWRWKP